MGETFEDKAPPRSNSNSSDHSIPRVGSVATVERELTNDEWDHYRSTKRGLTPRHVQLMAIGGSIGTGLFVGIGSPLSNAGPLSVFLGYCTYGLLFIWPCCLCVGEMMAYLPSRGSIFELASRYVDPSLGFALGWTYFFTGAMLVCVEYSAVATVMQYWVPAEQVNPAAWIAMALVVCFVLNVGAVKYYGESEFIMAITKVLLIIGLILLTFITMMGGNPRGDAYGFRNWTNGQAMHSYYTATTGPTGRFLGYWISVRYSAFTVGGPDLICLAAGEIQNPRRTIPRVAKLVFYRLVGFYIIGVLAVGILCNSRDPQLLGAIEDGDAGAAASPWVLGIQNLGISGLPSLINAVILLSGWSCGNAYLYSSSRTLYGLARDGQAPKFLLKCTKAGAPVWAVTVVQLIGCLTFLVAGENSVNVFYWFVDLVTCATILTYTGMFVTFLGWYYALKAQGIPRTKDTLPYISPLAPYSSYWAIGFGLTLVLFIGWDGFVPWSTRGFITSYFALPFSVVMYVFWKITKKTKIVRSVDADLVTGKRELDAECAHWEEGGVEENEKLRLARMSFARRCWERLW